MRPLIIVSLIALCSGFGPPAYAIQLGYKVKTGDQWKQKLTSIMEMTVTAGGRQSVAKIEVSGVLNYSTTSVDPNGSFTLTVEQKLESSKISINGQIINDRPDPSKPVKMTLSKSGKVIKVEGTASPQELGGASALAPVQYPEKDVKTGDTWDIVLPIGFSPKEAPDLVQAKGKLLSIKTEGGRTLAEVECTIHADTEPLIKAGKLKPNEKVLINITVVRMVDVITGIPTSGTGTIELDTPTTIQGVQGRQTMKGSFTFQSAK